MSLSEDDIKRIRETFKPHTEAVMRQADGITELNKKVAGIESTVKTTKELVENQATRCDRISSDLYKQSREHGERIATVETEASTAKEKAKEACERSKAISNRLWAGLVAIVFLVVNWLWNKINGGGG